MSLVKPSDYVFMQFGNNDMQTRGHNAMWPADDHDEDWTNVHSDADTDYQTILKDWSARVKAKGAIPVIVAPYTKQRSGAPDRAGLRTIRRRPKMRPTNQARPFSISPLSAPMCLRLLAHRTATWRTSTASILARTALT